MLDEIAACTGEPISDIVSVSSSISESPDALVGMIKLFSFQQP